MSAGTTVERYGAEVTTVDIPNKIVQFVIKSGTARQFTLAYYPTVFTWPEVGDQIMVSYENGQWALEGWFDTAGAYQEANPGDAVIRSATGNIQVVGGASPWTISPPVSPIPTWTALPFGTNWANYDPSGNTFELGEYSKDLHGFVHLHGLILKSTAWLSGGDTIATLPAGFRPKRIEMFHCLAFDSVMGQMIMRVDIASTGVIGTQPASSIPWYTTPALMSWFSLAGINFAQGH